MGLLGLARQPCRRSLGWIARRKMDRQTRVRITRLTGLISEASIAETLCNSSMSTARSMVYRRVLIPAFSMAYPQSAEAKSSTPVGSDTCSSEVHGFHSTCAIASRRTTRKRPSRLAAFAKLAASRLGVLIGQAFRHRRSRLGPHAQCATETRDGPAWQVALREALGCAEASSPRGFYRILPSRCLWQRH